MPETAVTNTGPPLHLAQIGLEGHLTMFARVSLSEHIREELSRRGLFERIATTLGERLGVERVTSQELQAQQATLAGFTSHQADWSVAALAARLAPDVVLTDDLALRRGLEARGHTVVGSVGVLIRAFKTGRCTKADLDTSIDQLFDGSTLYLSTGFRAYVRQLLKSLPE
ncbi:MAG: hypothetical protein HYZ81_26495 [Nitrospinae bacterium]|nr:hypothetical protein [Nitrospinota bacterium]